MTPPDDDMEALGAADVLVAFAAALTACLIGWWWLACPRCAS